MRYAIAKGPTFGGLGLVPRLQLLLPRVSACYPRLGAYASRFERALAALREGDESMLASPLKDSYHTVWFEFHEDLIALSGRNRALEETAGS